MAWRKSALQEILLQAEDLNVDLADLLFKLKKSPVKTKAEADLICDLLKRLPAKVATGEGRVTSRLHA